MLTILVLLAALAGDPKPAVNVSGTLALNGYDAVAYVTDGRPVRGLPHLNTSWNGAVPTENTAATTIATPEPFHFIVSSLDVDTRSWRKYSRGRRMASWQGSRRQWNIFEHGGPIG
jgi:hypothetical protein